jgi:hypothetical protein
MKKLLSTIIFVTVSLAAQAKTITLDLPQKPGGVASDMVTMLAKDLTERGWNVKVVMSGNCAVTMRNLNTAKEPIATFWHNRFHLLTNPECASDLPDRSNFVSTMYRGPEYLCRVTKDQQTSVDWTEETGTIRLSIQEFPFQIEPLISYLRTNTKANVKTIVYRNSGEQAAAAASKEVDYVLGTIGPKLESSNLVHCQYTTNLTAVGDARAMKDHFKGQVVYGPIMQYMKAKNLNSIDLDKLRKDVRASMQQDHWQKWAASRKLDLDLDLSMSQQLDSTRDSVAQFLKTK